MRGLPKSIIKKYGISKEAWREYSKTKKDKVNKPKTRKVTTTRRSTRRMARKKKTRRSGKSILRTFFKFLRIGALAAPAATSVIEHHKDPYTMVNSIINKYTGYDPYYKDFKVERLVQGWAPYLMVCLVTYGIGKVNGLIRRL